MPELTPGTSLLLSETPHCAGKQQPENAVALPNHLHRMAPRHSDGQKSLFCPSKSCIPGHGWAKTPVLPNEGRFSQLRMGKSACFAQRKDVFPGSGTQNGRIWGTEVCFFGSGTPKRPVLGYGGEDFRAREPKMACFGVQGRGGGRSEERRRKG